MYLSSASSAILTDVIMFRSSSTNATVWLMVCWCSSCRVETISPTRPYHARNEKKLRDYGDCLRQILTCFQSLTDCRRKTCHKSVRFGQSSFATTETYAYTGAPKSATGWKSRGSIFSPFINAAGEYLCTTKAAHVLARPVLISKASILQKT